MIEDPLRLLEHQSNRALVLHAIHLGAWTVREIETETRLPMNEIRRLLATLVETKIIFVSTRKEKNEEGGRPTMLYLPAPNHHP